MSDINRKATAFASQQDHTPFNLVEEDDMV